MAYLHEVVCNYLTLYCCDGKYADNSDLVANQALCRCERDERQSDQTKPGQAQFEAKRGYCRPAR